MRRPAPVTNQIKQRMPPRQLDFRVSTLLSLSLPLSPSRSPSCSWSTPSGSRRSRGSGSSALSVQITTSGARLSKLSGGWQGTERGMSDRT